MYTVDVLGPKRLILIGAGEKKKRRPARYQVMHVTFRIHPGCIIHRQPKRKTLLKRV